ncbi:MAG: S-methyl-5-thioribose kinase [Synergistaceae bacterium]|jgi:5-methylthioribose kinase|nr:S-methyl-5-thioribose kinase [Synergistaceae bacterium]
MSYRDLDSETLRTYIRERTDIFGGEARLDVYEYGRSDADGDGYVNHLYRVRDESTGRSCVVKQAKPYLKVFGEGRLPLEVGRNATETDIMKIRAGIVPQYVARLYHTDPENNLYICEDCRDMAVMRYELVRGKYFPEFPRQIGEYMAKCGFYTSELFLDPITHKRLACRFVNPHMRAIMEKILFTQESFIPDDILASMEHDPVHEAASRFFWDKPKLRAELLKLRDIYMKKSECLQHGDLHTSNILVGRGSMKVIDMEYTHMGPFSADAGYLGGNLLYPYIAWFFRREGSRESRARYRAETLRCLRDTVREYLRVFRECWEKDVRGIFRDSPEYLEFLLQNYVTEMCGFTASQIISRVGGLAELPDFDAIEDTADRNHARVLALTSAYCILMSWEKMRSVDDMIAAVVSVAENYPRVRDVV